MTGLNVQDLKTALFLAQRMLYKQHIEQVCEDDLLPLSNEEVHSIYRLQITVQKEILRAVDQARNHPN